MTTKLKTDDETPAVAAGDGEPAVVAGDEPYLLLVELKRLKRQVAELETAVKLHAEDIHDLEYQAEDKVHRSELPDEEWLATRTHIALYRELVETFRKLGVDFDVKELRVAHRSGRAFR